MQHSYHYYHKRVVAAMKTAITPIKTIQTIAAAKYLNISKVMTEKTVHLHKET